MKPLVKKSCFCQSLDKGARNGAIGNIVIGTVGGIASVIMLIIIEAYKLSGNDEEKYIFGLSYTCKFKLNKLFVN